MGSTSSVTIISNTQNAYNDTPYAITSHKYISTDPNLTFDVANFKSDIWSQITQGSDGSVLLTGGAVAPHSWYLLSKQFANVPPQTTATSYQATFTFSVVPEPSAALSLLVFGTFGAGLLVKRQVVRK